jgi:hypothetical protein
MPPTPSTDLNITPAYREASRSARRKTPWWSAQATGVLGLVVLAGLNTWIGITTWNESRQQTAAQLQSALDTQSAAVDRWYQDRQSMLARVSNEVAKDAELKSDPGKSLRELGFAGYVIVSRDGHILSGSSETIAALKLSDCLRDVVQKALSNSAATSGVKRHLQAKQMNDDAYYIAFASPIWINRDRAAPPELPRTELALPNAALLGWVRVKDEFLPMLNGAKFGCTGRVYSPFHQKDPPHYAKPMFDLAEGGSGKPIVRASRRLSESSGLLYAEMDRDEAFAHFHAIVRPLTIVFITIALVVTAVAIQIARRLWMRRAQALHLLSGNRIGQYAIEEKIGEGGMGVVYRAKHLLMRRPAAIKLLDMNRSDSTSLARFEREVRTTALLNHPNTVAIYDYGLTAKGSFYYAMEYIDGVSLDKLIEDGPLSEGRTIHLLAQLCGSLGEAHQVGLIHRDIKPANVLVTQRGGLCDFVKLLDFGLVKAVKSKSVGITTDGSAVGTPLFMSPEAIESPDEVDSRSDLYSVGAIGYYLLTGKHVFIGKSSAEVCLKHIQERPKRPSLRGPNPISPDLEHLILQCLEKDRENRPPTAFDLQQSLLACGEAFTWTEDEAMIWWSKRKETDRRQEFADAAC